ncbi:MAG: hypothetical protein K8U03_01735 [Planctomycetia bacterium]|nr:hypothetical protein [Planctomycetia bacterium]
MNEDLLTPEDQRTLDRLVDGELNEGERRAILLRLEHSPDGWRRCALAFLEAQAWKLEARAVVTEPAPATPKSSTTSDSRIQPASLARKTWNGLSVWVPSVLAAGVLIAVIYPQWNGRWNKETYVPVARQSDPQLPAGAPAYANSGRGSENVRLVVAPGPGGEQRVVDVPLIEPDKMNEALFGQIGQQLTPEMVKTLEQNGNRVVRERRLMPITLGDGRRVVVPVEQVEIRPLGNQAFQ